MLGLWPPCKDLLLGLYSLNYAIQNAGYRPHSTTCFITMSQRACSLWHISGMISLTGMWFTLVSIQAKLFLSKITQECVGLHVASVKSRGQFIAHKRCTDIVDWLQQREFKIFFVCLFIFRLELFLTLII